MPVIDNEPHALTIRTGSEPYGCSNKEYENGYYMENRRYLPSGTFIVELKYIKHTMSTDCRYAESLRDIRCSACKHRGSGEQHKKKMEDQFK